MYSALANSLAEALKKILCSLLKKVVSESKRYLYENLGEVLWAYCMSYRMPTQLTPYALVYGVEVVLPLEIQIPLLRIAIQEGFHGNENDHLGLAEFEALDEKRLQP